jgi:hypothetical protein
MRDGRGVTVYDYDAGRFDDVSVWRERRPWSEVVADAERLAAELDAIPGLSTTLLLSPPSSPRRSPHGDAVVRVERI